MQRVFALSPHTPREIHRVLYYMLIYLRSVRTL